MVKRLIVLTLLLVLTSLLVLRGEANIPCNTVQQKAATCALFATGRAPKPSPACCAGVRELVQSMRSVDDKRSVCRCLKAGAKSFRGLQSGLLNQIPRLCYVNVPFPISMNTNCNVIH